MTVESSAKSTSSNSPTEVGEVSTLKLKFIFANNDGVHVEMECSPSHSVESVSKALIEHWPNNLGTEAPENSRIRLICMGKGVLGPPEATLEECEVPVFSTHPTPVNVSIKPIIVNQPLAKSQVGNPVGRSRENIQTSTDCCCIIS